MKTRGAAASVAAEAVEEVNRTAVDVMLDAVVSRIEKETGGRVSGPHLHDLCVFLATKYAVGDVSRPTLLSPSLEVDAVWHQLLLWPRLYADACKDTYAVVKSCCADCPVADFDVVDHDPAAADDKPHVKAQRRRTAANEMQRFRRTGASELQSRKRHAERQSGELAQQQPATKQLRLESGQEAADLAALISIKVSDLDGGEVIFKMKNTTRFASIFEAICARKKLANGSFSLIFDGKRVKRNDTPEDLDMEDGDEIVVVLEQYGC